MTLHDYKEWFATHKQALFDDLKNYLKIPSISSEPDYKNDVQKCAHFVHDYIEKAGMDVEMIETDNHPIVFAEKIVDPNAPTVMFYGHYDVQPVDPLDLWKTPPFEPNTRDEAIYARGAQDNKGQSMYVMQALKMLIEKNALKVNIKCLFEGEEEIGSGSLTQLLDQLKDKLKTDYLLFVDSGMDALDQPAVTFGVRGITTFDLVIQNSDVDLHSGSYGGFVYNPIRALSEVIASFYDSTGRINITGFHDDIAEIKKEEKEHFKPLEFDEQKQQNECGIRSFSTPDQMHPIEANWWYPSLEVNGIHGGYTGEGFKTVIPSKAYAKISCRTVPDQTPEGIFESLSQHIAKHLPEGMHFELTPHQGANYARGDVTSQLAQASLKAYSEVFDIQARPVMIGASIPIAAALQEATKSQIVFVGTGLPTDHIHAPNEHFKLESYQKGFLAIAAILDQLASS